MFILKELNLNMGIKEYEMYQDIPAKESGSTNECYGIPYENFKEYLQKEIKERKERVLASEIVYYESNNGNIDVADFTTTIMGSEDEYEFLQIILSENGNTSVSDEEFNSCVKAILDIYKKDEIIKVKGLIASELDQTKKEELVKKLIDLKRKCE